jgi:hypothetical protein
MIADQIKKRVSHETKEHFIDNWGQFNNPSELAKKLDDYEASRRLLRKNPTFKPSVKENLERPKFQSKHQPDKKTITKPSETPNWREHKKTETDWRTKKFEEKREVICYACNKPGHISPNCPDKLKNPANVNNLATTSNFDESFTPYLSQATVNGKKCVTLLRDSGSSLDLCPIHLIKETDFLGNGVWLKQPLDLEFRNLPLARIEITSPEFGTVVTKAAIVDKSVEMNHYLLGNYTQELIDSIKSKAKRVNAVITRSQATKDNTLEPEQSGEDNVESVSELAEPELEQIQAEEAEGTEEIPITLPIIETPSVEMGLANVSADQFKQEQRDCETLKSLWERVESKKTSEFIIDDGLLYRETKDHRGSLRRQLVIPEKFKTQILTLCHDGIGAHLGITKTKDKVFRLYFWPHSVKDIEDFVKSCDPCQRVGKPRDEAKAPLKLVPVIGEVFAKINIDIVGPLPVSERNNKYLLTCIDLASKYPEAIPLDSLSSENIINSLLLIFSRIGFPKEVVTDHGSYFMSNLTSTFFEKFGIKISHSSIYHPQSNPVERFHRTLKRLLKVMCTEQGRSWEMYLPSVLLALRTVRHNTTGFSPSELVHGLNLRTPEALLYEQWANPNPEKDIVTEYVLELINRLRKCQQLASQNEGEEKSKRKGYYDKGAVNRNFKEGDKVLVLASCKPSKMSVKWIGPGEIRKKLSETNYLVNIPGKREPEKVYHVNLLKPYFKRAECVNVLITEPTNSDLAESELDIIYPEASPDVYDFQDIMRDSELRNRCTSEQIEELGKLLRSHKNLFSNDPGRTHLIEHDIELISDKPIRSKPYRTSPRQTEIIKSEIKRMLSLGIIEIAESDYTSPVTLVENPNRDPRLCCDYRKLNSVIKTQFYPLPNMDERVEKVSAAKYISVIDLTKGYWQIPLSPRAQRYAAFVTTFGTYRPLVLPFGLVNAPYCFSKFMAQLLQGCDDFSVPYLDDVAIFSETWEEHLKHLDIVLRRIESAKLTIKPAKCRFAQECVKYLGHMVGGGRRTPTEAKIQAVVEFPTPRNKTQIRQFLGMSGYYARYIPNYAVIAEPLTRALKGKNRKEDVEWTEECDRAFKELKAKLTGKPVLYSPDFSKQFILQTDASDKGIGVVMAQKGPDNEDHPILYLSRKFTKTEQKFCTTEKECAGIIFAIKKLRHYLDGQKFTIETDHNPLVFLKTNSGQNPRLMRWALALQPFNYKIVHRAGKDIGHADCLSRMLREN